ncbi:MAG: DUF4097 domain-containing protein [Holophagales bacterium]|nr:DUF4097 domain-containing protein [Holophagales bacterium]
MSTTRPTIRRSPLPVGSGLLGVLLLLVALSWGSQRDGLQAAPSAAVTPAVERTERTLRVGSATRIELHNLAGELVVEGWQRQEARIVAELGAGAGRLEVEEGGARLRIGVTPRGDRVGSEGSRASLRLWMPKGLALEARTMASDITLRGLGGPVEVETLSGRVQLEVQGSEVDVTTVSGLVTVDGVAESLRIETVSGSVRVSARVPELEVETVNAGVHLEPGILRRASVRSLSGRVLLDAALHSSASVKLTSHNGRIELVLPEEVSATFELTTAIGEIENGLRGASASPTSPDRPEGAGKELRLVSGAGEARVEAESFTGTLALRSKPGG